MSSFLNAPPRDPATLKKRNKRKRIFDSIFKAEKPVKGPITLQHRRIFILPTRHGMNFIMLLVLLLLIAFIYNNNLTYMLAFMLLSILMVTILVTFRGLAGLIIATGHSKPAFLGEMVAINLTVTNPSPVDRFNIIFNIELPVNCDIAAYSSQNLTIYATPQQRGWFQMGTIRATSSFPLGLFRTWSPIRFDCPILIYPQPATLQQAFPQWATHEHLQSFTRKGSGDDFYGLKPYQVGDGIKQVHWKAYAKGQGLLTKHFSHDNVAEIWLDYAATPGRDVEERLSQLCRWVLDAEAAGLNYGFSLPGIRLPPAQGAAHYAQCLQALALF